MRILAPVVVAVLICGLAVYRFRPVRAQNLPTAKSGQWDTPQVLHNAATAAYTNKDEASVDYLAGFVLHVPFMLSPQLVMDLPRMQQASDMQKLVVEDVRKRLVQAELAYLRNGAPIVEEQAVADTFNMAADRLGLPDVSKVSALFVHYARMG